MRRSGQRSGRTRIVGGLVVANLLVALVVAWVWRQDSAVLAGWEPSADAAAKPVSVQPQRSTVDWSRRWAPDADADPTCADCNLLLIALDIFRPDRMPCFGHPINTTPNICEMVDNGMVFDTFMAHAYQTPIAQMANFTGLYPSRSGFVSFASTLDPVVPTLPERLQAAGYNTVAMGTSFEVMTDMSAADGERIPFMRPGLNPSSSFGRGFDRFVYSGHRNLPSDAIPWLRSQAERPWFLWLVFGTLHWPYGVNVPPVEQAQLDPPGYSGALRDQGPLNFRVLSRLYQGHIYAEDGEKRTLPVDDHHLIRARYDVGLRYVDRFIGELVDSLSEEQLQSTLIVLYGIHGEDLGEHGYYGHYDIFDVETRMAMVVLDPALRRAPARISDVVEGVDLAPTVLDLLGLPALPNIDGRSLMPAITAGSADPERTAIVERVPLWEDIFRHKSGMPEAFVERVTLRLDAGTWRDRAIRSTRYKLIHRTARAVEAEVSWYGWLSGEAVERPEWELYDLTADPTEQANVYAERRKEPEVLDLRAQLQAFEASVD